MRCHAGRCDGGAFRAPAPSPALVSFDCDHCSRSFLTAVGRSQHIRHKHPAVANARRIAARLEQIAKKRADRAAAAEAIGQRRRSCWSDEEVAVLVEKESELIKTGVKQINAAIARFLPGKTAKQLYSGAGVLGVISGYLERCDYNWLSGNYAEPMTSTIRILGLSISLRSTSLLAFGCA
ncbi:transcriptase [Octopus vulgaris]|uniref:Transcriptase n=1 Tax=Octopus vulgaris TaxID=6645 RepID=A0AA36B0B9_OCTVU|nr:transcriptase [Octopus vulgaris]